MNEASLKKEQVRVILTVTFGNILEWFEIYSYAFLAPVMARIFWGYESSISSLVNSFLVFGVGFLTRPFGAILFGRIGDLLGRKKSFLWSILIMTVPTFLMGCLPTYQTLGIWAPLLLCFLRLCQSIPASGETPGTACFLYEYSGPSNKRFMTSWTAFGNQIGAILGVAETFLMDSFMSDQFLVSWGWRISFWSGGLIGLLGFFLRTRLHETPVFKKMKEDQHLDKETTYQVIKKHRKGIGLGAAFAAVNAATFYLIATYIPTYFNTELGLSTSTNALISLSILFLTTILLPFFGRIGDKFNNKKLLISSTCLIIFLLYPLSFAINHHSTFLLMIIGFLYIIPITCITALLAYRIAHLFPASIRFTGFGLAFNLADGIIGGFTPALALFLLQGTHDQAGFCWLIFGCALISLFAYINIKD